MRQEQTTKKRCLRSTKSSRQRPMPGVRPNFRMAASILSNPEFPFSVFDQPLTYTRPPLNAIVRSVLDVARFSEHRNPRFYVSRGLRSPKLPPFQKPSTPLSCGTPRRLCKNHGSTDIVLPKDKRLGSGIPVTHGAIIFLPRPGHSPSLPPWRSS